MTHVAKTPLLAAVLALSAIVAAGAAVLQAGDSGAETTTLELHLRTDGGADRLEITDLGDLAVGDSRDYTTDSGKPVTVRRDEDGYAVELDGKTLRVDDAGALRSAGAHGLKMHGVELDGDAQKIVVVGEPRHERIVVRRGPDGGESAFAFTTGDAPHAMWMPAGLLERIETSEKFRALDDATQQIVRELVREAAGPLGWSAAPGDGGDAVEVWIERRSEGDDER